MALTMEELEALGAAEGKRQGALLHKEAEYLILRERDAGNVLNASAFLTFFRAMNKARQEEMERPSW